tara:strand:+ start:1475 stop:2032 length:558 start_codon:yes stop_codon:yes gene_type:complete
MKRDNYYQELEDKGYYKTIDKRSKDYREYKKWNKTKSTLILTERIIKPKTLQVNLKVSKGYESLKDNVAKQSEGVGDTVAKITKATGVDKLVKFIAGEDCGCDERQETLNKMFKYKKINCISEEDYIYLSDFLGSNPTKVNHSQKVRLITISNSIFNQNESTDINCSTCIVGIINKLKKYLQVYK